MAYLYSLIIGIVFANGIPHFIKGITAQQWDVPWKKPASAPTNIVWAIINWLIAVVIFSLTMPTLTATHFALFFIGMGITGYLLANHWSK
ncbi:hypothetical protein ACVQ8P_08495 [Dellaglioa sp. BT-FLS60]